MQHHVKATGADDTAGSLSGGNQQKVVLGREVDIGTHILIFNQPTRGLDMGAVDRIHHVMMEEKHKGKATPLIFTSLAFAFTYKANLFNIGAQGQFYMGSIAAVAISLAAGDVLPTALIILIVLIASFATGGAAGCFIGYVKARFGANEFLVSMMSTYVISAFMDYLLRTCLQETKAEYLQTDGISKAAYLPTIIPARGSISDLSSPLPPPSLSGCC